MGDELKIMKNRDQRKNIWEKDYGWKQEPNKMQTRLGQLFTNYSFFVNWVIYCKKTIDV